MAKTPLASTSTDRAYFLANISQTDSIIQTTALLEQILGKKLDRLCDATKLVDQSHRLGLSQTYTRDITTQGSSCVRPVESSSRQSGNIERKLISFEGKHSASEKKFDMKVRPAERTSSPPPPQQHSREQETLRSSAPSQLQALFSRSQNIGEGAKDDPLPPEESTASKNSKKREPGMRRSVTQTEERPSAAKSRCNKITPCRDGHIKFTSALKSNFKSSKVPLSPIGEHIPNIFKDDESDIQEPGIDSMQELYPGLESRLKQKTVEKFQSEIRLPEKVDNYEVVDSSEPGRQTLTSETRLHQLSNNHNNPDYMEKERDQSEKTIPTRRVDRHLQTQTKIDIMQYPARSDRGSGLLSTTSKKKGILTNRERARVVETLSGPSFSAHASSAVTFKRSHSERVRFAEKPQIFEVCSFKEYYKTHYLEAKENSCPCRCTLI